MYELCEKVGEDCGWNQEPPDPRCFLYLFYVTQEGVWGGGVGPWGGKGGEESGSNQRLYVVSPAGLTHDRKMQS